MIAPVRKSQTELFQANASFARIGSPTLTLLASKGWTSSAHKAGLCANNGYGGEQSRANKRNAGKHLLHVICALLLAIACRKRPQKPDLRSSYFEQRV